jgi:hypothetical protein
MSESAVRRRLFVHIGTHKTGTTSFQHWLREHEKELGERFDLGVYQGAFPNNREVGLACARPERTLPTRGIDQWVDPEWRRHVAALVTVQLARDEDLVLSAEALSFLRHDDEISQLAKLFGDRETLIIVALRNPEGFLRSWAGHLTRDGYRLSTDPSSFAYVGADSWLVDYPTLLSAYRNAFGMAKVRVVDYDDAHQRFGSVIPALMGEIVGVEAMLPEWSGARKNVGVEVEQSRRNSAARIDRRLLRLARHPISTTRRVTNRWKGKPNR